MMRRLLNAKSTMPFLTQAPILWNLYIHIEKLCLHLILYRKIHLKNIVSLLMKRFINNLISNMKTKTFKMANQATQLS